MSNFSTPIIRITGGGGSGTVTRITFNGVETLPDSSGNVSIDYQGFSGAYEDLTGKPVLFSGNYSDLVGAPVLAAVATSGSYNDLTEKPVIPAAQVNSDWNATTGVAQILNKPTIPTVPTNVSAFTNDAGYLDAGDIAPVGLSGNYADLTNKPDLSPLATAIQNASNIGTGTSLVSGKTGTNLDFRTLRAGNNVTLSVNAQGEIVISSSGGGTISGEANTSSSLGAGVSLVAPKNGADLPFRSLLSSAGLTWSQETNTVTLTLHSILQAWTNLTLAANTLVYATGAGTLGTTPLTAFARTLLDDTNAAAMQNTLGLALVASSGSYADLSNKPDLSVYAPLASPVFTGNPTAPTPAAEDTDTSIATTAFVRAAMALFGIGVIESPFVDDANTAKTSGKFVLRAAAINKPPGGNAGWSLDVTAYVPGYTRQVASRPIAGSCIIFERWQNGADTWTTWQEIWHTGNLIKQTSTTDTTPGALMMVGAFGFGDVSTLPVVTQAQLDSWTFGANGFTGQVISPAGLEAGTYLLRVNRSRTDHVYQELVRMNISTRRYERMMNYSTGVTAWQELWHAGNLTKQVSTTDTTAGALMTVGAFGLGASEGIPVINSGSADSLKTTGFYRITGYVTDTPSSDGLLKTYSTSTTSVVQEFVSILVDKPSFYRVFVGGVWTPWRELFHSGNFDPATKQDKSSVITTATTRTLALTDAWNYLRPNTSSSVTLTVPTNASVAFELGTEITLRASGTITIAAASGVTIYAPADGTLVLAARMTVVLKKVGTNIWDLIGQTVPA